MEENIIIPKNQMEVCGLNQTVMICNNDVTMQVISLYFKQMGFIIRMSMNDPNRFSYILPLM